MPFVPYFPQPPGFVAKYPYIYPQSPKCGHLNLLLNAYIIIMDNLNRLFSLGLEFCARDWCTPLLSAGSKYVSTYNYLRKSFEVFQLLSQGQH